MLQWDQVHWFHRSPDGKELDLTDVAHVKSGHLQIGNNVLASYTDRLPDGKTYMNDVPMSLQQIQCYLLCDYADAHIFVLKINARSGSLQYLLRLPKLVLSTQTGTASQAPDEF